jgi:polysaccharide biosynthesis/export protein
MLKSATFSKRIIGLMLLALVATACGGPVVKQSVPMSSPEMQRPFPEQEYRIQVGDHLDIKFFYDKELNEQVLVRPDGRISLQLVDEVKVIDMTPAELRAQLMEKYAKELVKPELTVIVKSVGGNKIFVDGEVSKSTVIDLVGPMTVMQSIAAAGGFKDTARRDEVILIRRGTDHNPAVTTLNMAKVIDGTDLSQDLPVTPYDIVYVPKSKIANVNLWFEQYLSKAALVIPNSFLAYYGVMVR